MRRLLSTSLVFLFAACGARSALVDLPDADAPDGPEPVPELCNALDDDLDLAVDEDFRDDVGRYVHDEHCGVCNRPCVPVPPVVLARACAVLDGEPVCAATQCADGFVISSGGRCVPAFYRLCLACTDAGDCGTEPGAACADVGSELRCVAGCHSPCPAGFVCDGDRCLPASGSCRCGPSDSFSLACVLRDPAGLECVGRAECRAGMLGPCVAPDEVCNAVDDDCDGLLDEGFRDARGVYSLDIANCGACGVDCRATPVPEGDLVCGGDPFAPTCVLQCPGSEDGRLDPGDRVDADRDLRTGCECTVQSLSDAPGPVRTSGPSLDVNCDGADGIVADSFYVAPDGDDAAPGSPTRPLRTLAAAMARASASLGTGTSRPHVFVASGSYVELLRLPTGIQLHGGYRRDFLSLDPDGFRVEIRAPADDAGPGGAALVLAPMSSVGGTTVVEWVRFRGLDASAPSSPTFGVVLENPPAGLVLRDLEVRAGVPGGGTDGANGAAGTAPTEIASSGAPPRGALEDAVHRCLASPGNIVRGGDGGRNACTGVSVDGGRGGDSDCPVFADFEGAGARGNATGSASGGTGGPGGQSSQGPSTSGAGSGCGGPVCCGLADFTVPTFFQGPEPGGNGGNGAPGARGTGCSDALGAFTGATWRPASATAGSGGRSGAGGGGGGAGGGAEMTHFDGLCEFADGIGGGGGGGGAGGCGGAGGTPGTRAHLINASEG